jgi:hypothetical protein
MTQSKAFPGPALEINLSERVKQLGYVPSKKIRLYGGEYEVVSEPFMEGRTLAVQVRTNKEIRTLPLPLTILHRVLKPAS